MIGCGPPACLTGVGAGRRELPHCPLRVPVSVYFYRLRIWRLPLENAFDAAQQSCDCAAAPIFS
eukprot:858494-Pyramimonas_sp.AAC.1